MNSMKNPITVEVNCIKCGSTTNLVVEQEDLTRYLNREGLVQDIFPYLSASKRELLVSQICPDCWNKIFNHKK